MERRSRASVQNASQRQSIRSLVRANAEVRRQQLLQKKTIHKKHRPKGTYVFSDVTEDLASTPGKLEIHPTKAAPTLEEVKDAILREKNKERTRYFSVPVKIYETDDEDTSFAYPSGQEFSKDDEEEVHRYGSRVVMNKAGHVVALEVRKDVMKRFKPKTINVDFCQCLDIYYDVSSKLAKHSKVRRRFMQWVLLYETLLKFPVLIWLMMQEHIIPLRDFLYKELLAFSVTSAILLLIRMLFLGCLSKLLQKKPVLYVFYGFTSITYCLSFSSVTTATMQYFINFVEYNQYEDPISLETMRIKFDKVDFFYPYFSAMFVIFHILQNLVLIGFLHMPEKVMDEMKNGYILVIIISQSIFLATSAAILYQVEDVVDNPGYWDGLQCGLAICFLCKWSMWRFYMLQELLRGKICDVAEDHYKIEALRLAI